MTSNFVPGNVVFTLNAISKARGKEGFFGVIRKGESNMGAFTGRFADTKESLLIPGEFDSHIGGDDSIKNILTMAFGGREPFFTLKHISNLEDILACSNDEALLELVKKLNN